MGFSYSLAGFLSVCQRLPSLFNPFVGILADRLSVRWFVILAPSISAVTMSLLGVAPHYTALVILLLIMGVGSTLFHVPSPVMVKHIAGNRIGKGMSYYMLGGEAARTLGPLIILGAVSLWGLEGTYRLMPFGIMASVLLYWKLRDIRVSDGGGETVILDHPLRIFMKFLPLFMVLSGITFFRTLVQGALTFYLPTYLTVKGESLWVAGVSLSVIQFAGAAGTFCCGTISDKLGRKRTLLVLGIVTPILMWAFILFDGILTIPLLIVLGFTLFAVNPVLLALVQETESGRPAFINGIYMGLNFLIASVSVLMLGWLGDTIGLEKTYKLAATLGFGAIFFVLRLHDDSRRVPVASAGMDS